MSEPNEPAASPASRPLASAVLGITSRGVAFEEALLFCDADVCIELHEDIPVLKVWRPPASTEVLVEVALTPEAARKLAVQGRATADAHEWRRPEVATVATPTPVPHGSEALLRRLATHAMKTNDALLTHLVAELGADMTPHLEAEAEHLDFYR